MTENTTTLAARLRADEVIVTAWSGLAPAILCELLGRAGYPAITLDMQHGQHDIASVREGLASTALGGAHRVARIPVGENATASRLLDLGAEAVIAPMINSADDARAFVDAIKYPPVGARSWGPHRGAMLMGRPPMDYLRCANDETLGFAMIETPEAFEVLDEILQVPGLDAVFVGPADLSLTLSNGAELDPENDATRKAAAEIATRTRAAGKIAGKFCTSVEDVAWATEAGFRFLAYGVDMLLFTEAASDLLTSIGTHTKA
ncbi:HpcH/HpaI aldolase family protein [Roseibium algae]|uniref:Aldolase/citrate lyase family protein n=1 Tax=Roseibium algae TaxID=3123038 RepID=A0ABU8TNT7_9HYPH